MNERSVHSGDGINKEKLMVDMRAVVNDAEELLRATSGQAGEKISAARERIQANLAVAKDKIMAAEHAVVEKSKQAAKATNEYVHENPWKSVGIAAGAGVILGFLLSRRR